MINKETLMRAVEPIRRYVLRILHVTSELVNVIFFFGLNPAETVSSRCYRLRDKGDRIKPWRLMQFALDFVARPFHTDHCKKSYETSLSHAFLLIDNQDSV